MYRFPRVAEGRALAGHGSLRFGGRTCTIPTGSGELPQPPLGPDCRALENPLKENAREDSNIRTLSDHGTLRRES